MKTKRKLTLQWRVTLLAGAVMAICMLLLTIGSILNASAGFNNMAPMALTPAMPASEDSGIARTVPAQAAVLASDASRTFTLQSVYIYLGLLVVGMAVVYFVVGRALKPVRNLSHKINDITSKNLSTRLPQTGAKDEVGELTTGFNRMLGRLDDAFERQKQFTGNAAHELKTPLTVIKTGMQVLHMDEEPSPADYREVTDATEKSVERLIGVVDDLLSLASESPVPLGETVELQPLLQTVADEMNSIYADKHIAIHLMLNEMAVQGDAGLLYRAFANLVENALKYGKEGGTVNVTAQRDGLETTVTIQDTGIGIPAESLPLIFEPFYRVDASRNRKIAGSGLGLSITKAIFERHGASITAVSPSGEGTTFTVRFLA